MSKEKDVKPSVIPSIYSIMDQMKGMGLTEDDLIHLIQRRTGPKVSKANIRATIEAVREIEKNFESAKDE